MYIKRYTIAAFILMAVVGSYVFMYITQDATSIDFFGVQMPSLSIAFWVVVPLFILYLASAFHMLLYSFVGTMSRRKYEKDYDKLIDAIVDGYLGKKTVKHNFKTDRYKLLGTLLENTTIFPSGNVPGLTKNEKLDAVLKCIEDIKNGDVVDLKQYNLASNNELAIQNERNRYKKGELTTESILSNPNKYPEVLRREIFVDYVKSAKLSSIEKYKSLMTKEALYKILSRVNADENILVISNNELISLIKTLKLSKNDYIKLSSVISGAGMIPEQRMKLFELLSDEDEEAVDGYLYTLFDLEMLAPADAILNNTQENEYKNFKAYRALRVSNKNFSIELFV